MISRLEWTYVSNKVSVPTRLWFKMTSLSESEAHFVERAKEYALPDTLLQSLACMMLA